MCFWNHILPSMVPHFVFLPKIRLPFTWYSWSLPTTAKGIISCWAHTCKHMLKCTKSIIYPMISSRSCCGCFPLLEQIDNQSFLFSQKKKHSKHLGTNGFPAVWTYPDFVIDQPVLCILIKLLLRVNINPIGSQLFPDLHKVKHNVKMTHYSKLAEYTW